MSITNKDDKLNPLLDSRLEEELKNLKEEYSHFSIYADEIKSELDQSHLEDKISFSDLTFKLQRLKSNMEIINDKIKLLRNFCKDDDSSNVNSTLVLLKNIRTISSEISRKYDVVNTKFNEKIEKMKKSLQNEMTQNKVSQGALIDSKLHLNYQKDHKYKIDVDRLKERQDDIENITKITSQLLHLSRDIRQEAEKQGKVIMSIEDHITEAQVNSSLANGQLNMRRTTQNIYSKLYCWIASCLFLVLATALCIMFWKLKHRKADRFGGNVEVTGHTLNNTQNNMTTFDLLS